MLYGPSDATARRAYPVGVYRGRGKAIVLTLRGRWHAHWAGRNTTAGCQVWRSCIRCCHDRSGPASSRRGFVPAGDSLQPPVERLVRVTFLVEQRPEKTMAQRCLDLRLRPKEWPFGERMGSNRNCAFAKLQVSEVSQRPRDSEVMFGFIPLTSAPGSQPRAGFEPALTAPEADPVHRFYLAKRTLPVRLGSVWGERRIRTAGPGCSHIFRPASGPGGAHRGQQRCGVLMLVL